MKITINIDDQILINTKQIFSKRRLMGVGALLVLGSAIAVAAPLSGVPHTFSQGQVISAEQVNNNFQAVINGINDVDALFPSGTVMMFDLDNCPVGWSAFQDAQGRYLLGKQPAGQLGQQVGTPLTDGENRAAGDHTHGMQHRHIGAGSPGPGNAGNGRLVYSDIPGAAYPSFDANRTDTDGIGTPAGTNAPYIQLTVCRRN